MNRVALYGVPGIDAGAPLAARRLRHAAESWYAAQPKITQTARRYGFHATLKAPFTLAQGNSITDLEQAVAEFVRARPPVLLAGVRVAALGAFRALVPRGDHGDIDLLAADVVRSFERFRAPLTEGDIARRCPDSLTPRQRDILHEYGYPFALDEFRVHFTLTDPLPDGAVEVDTAIAEHFADFDGADIPLTSLAIVTEPDSGLPFAVHSIHPFREAL